MMHKRVMIVSVLVGVLLLSMVSASVGSWFRETFGGPTDIRLSPALPVPSYSESFERSVVASEMSVVAEGKVGKGLSALGASQSQFYLLPQDSFPPIAGSPKFSFGVWFKTTFTGVGILEQVADDSSDPYELPPSLINSHVPALYVDTQGKLRSAFFWESYKQVVSSQTVNDGQWHHALVTYDGALERLYIDGALTGSVSKIQRWADGNTYFLGTALARGWSSVDHGVAGESWMPFKGTLDEVQVYSSALSDAQVKDLYDSYAGGSGGSGGALICTDSDGGLNYAVKGSVSQGGYSGTDWCQDSSYLFELDCGYDNGVTGSSHTGLANQRYLCPNGCSNGACLPAFRTVQLGEWANKSEFIQINATHKVKVIRIENSSTEEFSEDIVTFTLHTLDGTIIHPGVSSFYHTATITGEGTGSVTIGGSLYVLTYRGASTLPSEARQARLVLAPPVTGPQTITAYPRLRESSTFTAYGNYVVRTGDIINFGNAHKKILVLEVPTCADKLCVALVNRQVVRFYDTTHEAYHELEEGQSLTLARNDQASVSSLLSDVRASVSSITITYDGTQRDTLANNNEATISLSKRLVCQQLIDDLQHPDESFVGSDGTKYFLTWNTTYVDDQATSYFASWQVGQSDQVSSFYSSHDLTLSARVYHDPSYYVQDFIDSTYCSIKEISGNKVLVCSYHDPTDVDDEALDWEGGHVFVSWVNQNVIVSASIGDGRTLTPEKIDAKVRDVMLAFTAHLQNNRFVSSDQGERIFYNKQSLLYGAVAACPSTITADVDDGLLFCKREPLVCPPHGYQTLSCIRNGADVSETRVRCSPGICAGCMVPRWWGARTGENICLPYGTRLITANVNRATLRYADMQVSPEWSTVINDDSTGTITLNEDLSDRVRFFSVNGQDISLTKGTTFTFNEGSTYTIEIADSYEESAPYTFEIIVEDIIKRENVEDSQVVLRFSEGKQPMYCNYDGSLFAQKIRDPNGDLASCQNNYECESNVCSSGECIEVQSLLKQEKGFKTFAIKALCRIVNLFSDDEYNQCLSDYMGLPPPIAID